MNFCHGTCLTCANIGTKQEDEAVEDVERRMSAMSTEGTLLARKVSNRLYEQKHEDDVVESEGFEALPEGS